MKRVPLSVFLAALPLLAFSLEARSGFFYGAVGAGAFLGVRLGFFLISKVLPEYCHRLLFWLLLGAVPLGASEIFEAGSRTPFLLTIVSLLILTAKDDARHVISPALFYWFLLTAHGLVTETLGYFVGLSFFQQPAGSFFLMGLAVTFFARLKETP